LSIANIEMSSIGEGRPEGEKKTLGKDEREALS